MSRTIIDEPPILVLPALAQAIGLNEAIILQQLHFWITTNSGKEIDGRRWIYNSLSQWRDNFPWWSEDTVQRTLARLEARGLVLSANYNKLKQDRTKWYTIEYQAISQLELDAAAPDHHRNLRLAKPQISPTLPETTSKEGNTTYSDDQPAPPASPVRQPSQRKVVPVELISLFCRESGVPELEPSSKKEYAEYQTLWHKPLYHIHHVLCADNQAESTALIRQSIQQMRERGLDISSPNSIKKVATAIKARNNRQRVVSVY